MTLSQKIINSGKPFYLFHTWEVTEELLAQAISQQRSIDLDIAVDDLGHPYLGHSKEYHELSGERWFKTMPLWDAVNAVATSGIVVNLDCKHFNAWPVIADVVSHIGPSKCLVCSFISELRYHFSAGIDRDYPTEWSNIETLQNLKSRFPDLTITACAKGLPDDLFVSKRHSSLLRDVRATLSDFGADTVCLSVPDYTIDNAGISFFLEKQIVPHIAIDHVDTTNLTQVYIGETDHLNRASFFIE